MIVARETARPTPGTAFKPEKLHRS